MSKAKLSSNWMLVQLAIYKIERPTPPCFCDSCVRRHQGRTSLAGPFIPIELNRSPNLSRHLVRDVCYRDRFAVLLNAV